jgi:hypothetical protein
MSRATAEDFASATSGLFGYMCPHATDARSPHVAQHIAARNNDSYLNDLANPNECDGCRPELLRFDLQVRKKPLDEPQQVVDSLVPAERFELPTNGLQNRCSTS